MAPKAKFSREEVIQTAFEIVRTQGVENLNARALAEKLKCSTSPIFTMFGNMEEAKQELFLKVKEYYMHCLQEGSREKIPFKGVGTANIKFAAQEPHLYRWLFMTKEENVLTPGEFLFQFGDLGQTVMQVIETVTGLKGQAARELYENMWIFTHGISALIVTGVCNFSEEEISRKLTAVFEGTLLSIKKAEQ